jgi:hypothetical protein
MKFLFLASILLAGCLLADVIVAEDEEDADDTNTPAPDDEAGDGEAEKTDAPDAEPSEEEEGTPAVDDPNEVQTVIATLLGSDGEDSKPAEVIEDSVTKSEDESATDTSSNLIRSFMSFLIPTLLAAAIL